jgi:hypothetical protein
VFDVEEINPPNYVDMGPLVLRAPTNLSWRVKVSYKGKTESVGGEWEDPCSHSTSRCL